MKVYFDTEFTGLHKDTTLISIGMIDENNRTFYAELTDYDRTRVDKWIEENVIGHLNFKYHTPFYVLGPMDDTKVKGNKTNVREALYEWLKEYDEVQFVSDVCHFDFVLLIDLFDSAFDLPDNVNPACHDINQDIAKYLNISEKEAFDLSREELISTHGLIVRPVEKHNSLYDAKVIREIDKKLISN